MDHAVMEKYPHEDGPDDSGDKRPGMVVIPFDGQWSDVGNWNAGRI